MNIDLKNKNALVGAATQGIGLGIAIELAKCGANVTIMARNEEKLKKSVTELPVINQNQKHQYLVADFSDLKVLKRLLQIILKTIISIFWSTIPMVQSLEWRLIKV
nr:SDR family NAD(P)-dependent oxidoreductase [Chryseobacterium sp. G0201]